ncbi:DUF3466 family protein [Thalassomonas actiniarum]|uniref:DUF3466 family protein n=1 Tax=Thalassomonas actiniarum TaxID=485447 RepID=A0AAE9YVN5_9GAMM|nr:DUF3466 family protein [Thalassomonas actiniarum]WDE01432.1 DUF3466 family protein [Thalassomonas actiniarum]
MKKFVKSILAAGITSALCIANANAATYQVIDTGEVSGLEYTFAQKENVQGAKSLAGSNIYNFPVQYQYLDDDDFDNIDDYAESRHESVIDLKDLEDLTALKAGTPTGNDLAWARIWLSAVSDTKYQKVGDSAVLLNVNGETEEITIFDTTFDDGQLTRSTTNTVYGITNEGWVFGTASAPYLPLDFTESDGDEVTHWVRDFTTRAFLTTDNGNTIKSILPEEASYGGESGILDINDNRVAVGFASTKLYINTVEDFIEDECADPDYIDDIPVEVCLQSARNGLYHLSAYKWTLDESGDVISSEDLGMLVTPHEDDERVYTATAQAINNHGVAVGFADGWVDENETSPSEGETRSTYAVVFKDGEVTDFTEDHGEYYASRANDINDEGIAVGYVTTIISGEIKTKFYYVDTNAENMQMVFPDDYFTGSASIAEAINENGMIVGTGEVETHNTSSTNPRRRHAFLYNMNDDSFVNLNDLLPCDSAYTIVEATDINEDNEIFATAVVKNERRDAKGELMRDANGEIDVEDVVRAVKLVPIDGDIEGCNSVVEKVERSGAGFGLLSLFAMLTFGLRRKLKLTA